MIEYAKTCKESRTVQTHRICPLDANNYKTLCSGNLARLIDNSASISIMRHARRETVTISVDALNYLLPLPVGDLVCIETYVSGVGKTSIEVFCKIIGENVDTGERYLAATSFLTYVALRQVDELSFVLPRVQPETSEEYFICAGYKQRRKERLRQRAFQEALGRHTVIDIV